MWRENAPQICSPQLLTTGCGLPTADVHKATGIPKPGDSSQLRELTEESEAVSSLCLQPLGESQDIASLENVIQAEPRECLPRLWHDTDIVKGQWTALVISE